MQESSNSSPESDPRRQLAALKFQRAAGKLYEDLIRATHDARDKQSNEGIHTATSYMRRTADALIERFQTIEELFEANYLNGYKHQSMSDEDNTWLRKQAEAVVDAELKRAQRLIEKLCSSFTGGSPQQYAKYVGAAESEAALMKARLENGITIQMLEHQAANPKPSTAPAQWDVFVSHASEDKAYVEVLVQKLTEAGIKVWFDRTSIDWGSDLRIAIDHGLKSCTYGIVVNIPPVLLTLDGENRTLTNIPRSNRLQRVAANRSVSGSGTYCYSPSGNSATPRDSRHVHRASGNSAPARQHPGPVAARRKDDAGAIQGNAPVRENQ